MQIQAGKKINDIATVSDEAFVLLILQNIWQDMMKLDIDDYYWPKKGKRKAMMKAMMTIMIKAMKTVSCASRGWGQWKKW